MGSFSPGQGEQPFPLSAGQLEKSQAVDTSLLSTPVDPNPDPEKLSGLTMMDTLWDLYETEAYKHDWADASCTVKIVPAVEKAKDPYNITPLSFRDLVNLTMVDPEGKEYYPPLEDYERLVHQVNSGAVPLHEWQTALNEVVKCHKFLMSYIGFHRVLQLKPLLDYMNLYDWWNDQKPISGINPSATSYCSLESAVEICSGFYILKDRYADAQCYSYIYGPDDGVNPGDKKVQDFLDWLGSFLVPDPPYDDDIEFYVEKRPTFPHDALPRTDKNYAEDEFWLRIDFADYYNSLLKRSISCRYLYYEYKELFDWWAFVYTRLMYEIESVDAKLAGIIDRYHSI